MAFGLAAAVVVPAEAVVVTACTGSCRWADAGRLSCLSGRPLSPRWRQIPGTATGPVAVEE